MTVWERCGIPAWEPSGARCGTSAWAHCYTAVGEQSGIADEVHCGSSAWEISGIAAWRRDCTAAEARCGTAAGEHSCNSAWGPGDKIAWEPSSQPAGKTALGHCDSFAWEPYGRTWCWCFHKNFHGIFRRTFHETCGNCGSCFRRQRCC